MGDKIVVMNHGVVEQFGTPQEVYDHPATLFVADFIGSPPMNVLAFEGRVARGARAVSLGSAEVAVPEVRADAGPQLVLGVRPEHVEFDDGAAVRARIEATEYLGTTQIVTLSTPQGVVRARRPAAELFRVGDQTGLRLVTERITLFDAASGQAVPTAANEGAHRG
jgi:multiple sugar transport system ATP-binding protein